MKCFGFGFAGFGFSLFPQKLQSFENSRHDGDF